MTINRMGQAEAGCNEDGCAHGKGLQHITPRPATEAPWKTEPAVNA